MSWVSVTIADGSLYKYTNVLCFEGFIVGQRCAHACRHLDYIYRLWTKYPTLVTSFKIGEVGEGVLIHSKVS